MVQLRPGRLIHRLVMNVMVPDNCFKFAKSLLPNFVCRGQKCKNSRRGLQCLMLNLIALRCRPGGALTLLICD
jgi:hypothetical protein